MEQQEIIKELQRQVNELQAWKESAIRHSPDVQEIAREINVPLGKGISENIVPWIKKLKLLLREVCVRANIIFPENERDITQFDEQFGKMTADERFELMMNLNGILRLGEIDAKSTRQNSDWMQKINDAFTYHEPPPISDEDLDKINPLKRKKRD